MRLWPARPSGETTITQRTVLAAAKKTQPARTNFTAVAPWMVVTVAHHPAHGPVVSMSQPQLIAPVATLVPRSRATARPRSG
ncbi:hypothetical protein OK006_9019 [Actinobacteria bacterium OK006]|nr:hypothetical protein OK006_9019 [Actinobacteria bacterium OK006]